MDFSLGISGEQASRPMCHCLGVHAEEVRTAIADHDLSSVRGVARVCGAGGGCTSCHRHIKRMLQEHATEKRLAVEMPAEPVFGFA